MAETFRHQVVLITGASDGIGRELALQLAGEGARLALASRNREKLEQVARECEARGGRALAVPTDVGAASACRNLIDAVLADLVDRPDVRVMEPGDGVGLRQQPG